MYLALDEPPLDGRGLEYNIVPVVEVKASGAAAPSPHLLPPYLFKPTLATGYQDFLVF